MSGFAAISVDPETYPVDEKLRIGKVGRQWQYVPRFIWDLFWCTFFAQHRGPAFSGLVTATLGEDDSFDLRIHRGPFRDKFEGDLTGLDGNLGIGHISDSTTQPYLVEGSRLGPFAICFDGNVTNLAELIRQFQDFGQILPRADDVGILAHLIGLGTDFIDGFKKAAERAEGTFLIAILTPDGIYVVQSPDNHKPAVIGQKTGAVAIISESCQLANTGFTILRDVAPGEVLLLRNGKLTSPGCLPSCQLQRCSFEQVYTAYPTSNILGRPVSVTRRELGARLAQKDIAQGFLPDLVIPVPDSGRFCATGYKWAFDIALMNGKVKRTPIYYELLTKYPHARRSFTPASKEERDLEAQMKLLAVSGSILELLQPIQGLIEAKLAATKGQKIIIDIVVCDDSIVRGTQTTNKLVPKLKALLNHIKSDIEVEIRIHFRISNPPLLSYCPFGKATKRDEPLAAVTNDGQIRSEEQIAERLGVASVRYNTIDDLAQAIDVPLTELCVACDRLPT